MTSRRNFIKALASLPPVLALNDGWASAPDPSRLALIIGNSAYRNAPLLNPANDASAVAGLFTQAGFTVDSRLNTTYNYLMAAMERFTSAAKRPETKQAVFYYAGHGAQLDWRNYLLPVDAMVERQDHLKQRCVDLSLLLGQLSAAKDKTFIIILDACRNNPFGTSYRPEQKGLSQFDAPVGSLLAYATSPGNVASDGEGANGLYTENLVRELSKRNARLEDALKRVRLNVRLASNGEQIPWETTSLESDVFIFNDGQKKLSETELEKLLEADITEWSRIKSSRKVDDWVGYLRNFPNGRFAEIAQMRLTRLLTEVEKTKVVPVTANTAIQQQNREREEAAAQDEKQKLETQRAQEEQKRLAAERKQLEEQQAQEQRRRREEQQAIELKHKQEQERLDRERQRIVEAERRAAERKQQEEQRLQAEQKAQDQQKRLAEQQRLEQERLEREKISLAETQRIAAERKRLEEQERQEQQRRRDEQQALELKRRQEEERLDRERQRITEAERLAEVRKQQESQRLAEQKRIELEKLAVAKPQAMPPASPNSPPNIAAKPAGAPLIHIEAGLDVPVLMAPSANPYSAGRYPLRRLFTVGDEASYIQTDLLTGVDEGRNSIRASRVDIDEDRVEFNEGSLITDLMGNLIKNGAIEFSTPLQWTPAEFQVGNKWTASFRRSENGITHNAFYDMKITARETITVPAGKFDTFRIEGSGWNSTTGARLEVTTWLAPSLNFFIKRQQITRTIAGKFVLTARNELVSIRQHAIAQSS